MQVAKLVCLFFFVYLALGHTCTSPFGDASFYNLFSLSSVTGCNSDVEGRVAANGPVTLENYSIGLLNQINEGYSLVRKIFKTFDL